MKQFIKNIVPTKWLDYYAKLNYSKQQSPFYGNTIQQVFTNIYKTNHWGNKESISGVGSSLHQTKKLIPELNKIFKELAIKSLLDAPCGDFNWMQYVNLSEINYLGVDIVEPLILENKQRFENERIKFSVLDMVKDTLPQSDLILIRDCWVHFSYNDIKKSMAQIKASNSKYLMATSFKTHQINHNITTGDWRPLNLERPPFNFPKPLCMIEEYFPKGYKKEAKGKALAIWKLNDLT